MGVGLPPRGAVLVVIGVGIDSIEIARVAQAIRKSPRLRERLFTEAELAQLPGGGRAWSRLAALFAAKEAVFKALGTGLVGHSWQQVEVLHGPGGEPGVNLVAEAAATAARRGIRRLHISLSHDRERATAICIGEG